MKREGELNMTNNWKPMVKNKHKMKKNIRTLKIIILFSLIPFHLIGIPHAQSSGKNKQIVGWIEYVTILPENLKIKAKLDTGARSSSLNAVNVAEFKRGGDTFVRFALTNWKGRIETIEAKVIRMAKIKKHYSDPELRPVIRIGICLKKISKEVEVNLVNRSNFNYQLLIGRSFLKGAFVIDPAKTFTVKTDCQKDRLNE
jgi:hypothetical protein